MLHWHVRWCPSRALLRLAFFWFLSFHDTDHVGLLALIWVIILPSLACSSLNASDRLWGGTLSAAASYGRVLSRCWTSRHSVRVVKCRSTPEAEWKCLA